MRLSSREIIKEWQLAGISLAGIERSLDLQLGSLFDVIETEWPAEPALETLLNMVNSFPPLLDVADKNFNQET